ncbi:MAG: VWA domain-containing protein [Frankia sp.]|nr:VWA domain-containing protein [Frankia sp.]
MSASDTAVAPGLVDRTVAFVGALREAGLPVSLSESIDGIRALGTVPLLDRLALRAGLAATVVKRPAHRAAFDVLFDLYFPPVLGADDAARTGRETDDGTRDHDGRDPRPMSRDAADLREALRALLLSGDDDALRRLARASVTALGRADTQPGRQSFFSYRVLRALSPDTLMAGLLAAMLADTPRGGLAEQVARATLTERMRRFEAYVESDVRRRLAAERGVDAVAKSTVRPLAETVDFLRASREDLVELRRAVLPLARRLATRLAARRRRGRRGRLDFRRTVRASLATGGVPVVTRHRPYRPHKPELVILCDVSGSVSAFARFTLMLAYSLREQFTKVRAFAFVDGCDEVTRFFADGDFDTAMTRLSREASVVWFDGHSDYGHAFEDFAERWPDALTPRTSLLVLGDARTNYRSPALPTFKALTHQARHSYWLNPEPREYWDSGDSVASRYAELVDEMVECRNAAQLSAFVARLLPV